VTRIGSVYSVVRAHVDTGDMPESFAEAQQILAAGFERDAHVTLAVVLAALVELCERFGLGAEIDEQPAQRFRAGDRDARSKGAIKVEIHPLHGADAGSDEVNENVAHLDGSHAHLGTLCAAVIAHQVLAHIAKAGGRSELAAMLTVQHQHHARL
jgi:hypothetical protein